MEIGEKIKSVNKQKISKFQVDDVSSDSISDTIGILDIFDHCLLNKEIKDEMFSFRNHNMKQAYTLTLGR